MANTFKLKTKTGVNGSALSTVYTVPSSTTTVIIGLTIANIKGASITGDVQIVTAATSGENGDNVYVVKDVPLPAGSSIEIMAGNKLILNAGDIVKAGGSNSSGADADIILSIMEIT
ncbi:MAG: hypothetical protein ACKVJK_06615 [Methylophagaceae bacterium]|jgi:hypothetical protein|tara:strand:+ start:960 stop:1310 length:351 start_codon:yes stop_codon:yes gene_type:complete